MWRVPFPPIVRLSLSSASKSCCAGACAGVCAGVCAGTGGLAGARRLTRLHQLVVHAGAATNLAR